MSYKEQKAKYLQRYADTPEAEQRARNEGYEAGYEQATDNWCNKTR